MILWRAIVGAIVLGGCHAGDPGEPRAPAIQRGPASLQLVPADFYGRSKRPAPQTVPRHTPTEAAPDDDGEAELPPEIAERVEQINERLQRLRLRLNDPPRPRGSEPPT